MQEIRTYADEPGDQPRGVTYSPASYAIQGRAEAFAATLGDGAITPEHVLLALLWDPMSMPSHILWELGVARERVLARLREDGVPVPSAALPPQREIDLGERVWFARDKVGVVLDRVRLHLSPETTWGFNYEDDRAWVIAESSVDLQALIWSGFCQVGVGGLARLRWWVKSLCGRLGGWRSGGLVRDARSG